MSFFCVFLSLSLCLSLSPLLHLCLCVFLFSVLMFRRQVLPSKFSAISIGCSCFLSFLKPFCGFHHSMNHKLLAATFPAVPRSQPWVDPESVCDSLGPGDSVVTLPTRRFRRLRFVLWAMRVSIYIYICFYGFLDAEIRSPPRLDLSDPELSMNASRYLHASWALNLMIWDHQPGLWAWSLPIAGITAWGNNTTPSPW